MTITDLANMEGRTYPARRLTKNLVGGLAPIQCENFCMGLVSLDPDGGQVPWHNHEQEEVYFVLEGTGEMCIDDQLETVVGGQAVHIPPFAFHQLTNVGSSPLRMVYCYGPAGDVDHWKQELEGTLPKAGVEAPPLPHGAKKQHTDPPAE
jgi:mannose-6-phosphate isomerase-like protein (cupin superfamily)